MRHLLFFLLVLLSGLCVQAQNTGTTVAGVIIDSANQKPLPFVAVTVFKNRPVGKASTDSSGRFSVIGLAAGTYYLQVNAVGYRAFQSAKFTLNGQGELDLGRIFIKTQKVNLKEVTITARKPLIEQRTDGITFNVESLPSIAGSDATDVLRRVPMISVDPNGGLSIRESSNVKVYIDGNPSDIYGSQLSDVLRAIRGENIVKIEVITNPSAKYDAEGTDGVVNIITRKLTTNITNGHVGGILGTRTENLMGDIHSKQGEWLVNADAFNQKYWDHYSSILNRDASGLHLTQTNRLRQSGYYFFGGANVLFSADSLNTFTIGYRARPAASTTTTYLNNNEEDNGIQETPFQRTIRSPVSNTGSSFNAGYTGVSKNKQIEYSLLSTYSISTNNSGYSLYQQQDDVVNYRENLTGNNSGRDYIIQGDYSQSFKNKLKWETGFKVTGKHLKSANSYDVFNFNDGEFHPDNSRADNFAYTSTIYALYNNLSLRLKDWGFSAGLRYEGTALNADFKNVPLNVPRFDNFVPQVLINRIINDRSSFKLSYAMKIVRPNVSYLNPAVNSSDSLNIQFGNPYLKPEIINRYQLSYTINDEKLFKDVALFFNDNRNTIENIRIPTQNGVFESTWRNTGQNQRLGFSATVNWKPVTALDLGATFTDQYVWLKSPALALSNNGFVNQLVLNGDYKFTHGYSISLYGFFGGRTLFLQGYRDGWKFYSLFINKKTKNERFNISLRMDTFLTPASYINEGLITNSYHQLQTTHYDLRSVRLTVSYRIGKRDIKAPTMRQVEGGD